MASLDFGKRVIELAEFLVFDEGLHFAIAGLAFGHFIVTLVWVYYAQKS
jgi:hypothetical protein